MKKKILIIDDEEQLIKGLTLYLASEGYDVISALDGREGLNKALRESPDLILLDLILPEKDGLDVCRELRQKGVATPVIMLTAKGEEIDKVVGLEVGADDYVTKPFGARELLARIKVHLRKEKRQEKMPPPIFRFDDVEIDFIHFRIKRGRKESDITSLEAEILKYFVAHQGEIVSREALLERIWGYEKFPSTRTIDIHISKLRKKLESDPSKAKILISVYGAGYRFMGGF
jgi:DNA-binding response OmpR family regulator